VIRVARVVLITSLSLWVGGLSTISFVVAPTAFRTAPARQDAGKMVGASLRTFGKVELVCGVLALAASLLLYAKRPAGTRLGMYRSALIFLMLVITCSYVLWVYPDAATARMKLDTMPDDAMVKDYFAMIHRISVMLVSANILLGTGLLVCASAAKPSDAA
jgi:uncharacterized membrane protein